MQQKTPIAVYAVSVLLVVYTIMLSLNAPLEITGSVFFLSPFFMVWMTLSVLKMKTKVKDLAEGEEWGYADKAKEELGTF